MGTIYRKKWKDNNGKTQEGKTWWIQYYRNGRRYQESSKSNGKRVAIDLLKQREGDISKGRIPGIHFDRVTFEELAEGFLGDYRINQKKSLVRAERNVRHLRAFFEGYRVPEITTLKVQAYIEQRLEQRAKNATINRELSALKRMLNLGARQTPPRVDRMPYIPMLKENNTRKGFFEQGDFEALREALPDYLKGFATFAYKTGWRLLEIEDLAWP